LLHRYLGEQDLAELRGTFTETVVRDVVSSFAKLEARVSVSSVYAYLTDPKSGDVLRWASSIVGSRSFTISKPKAPTHPLHEKPFLAPGADILNHSPAAKVGWRLGAKTSTHSAGTPAEGESFQVYSHESYEHDGMEVFNHYQVRVNRCECLAIIPNHPSP
jgi:hypothetical protein